VTYFNESDHKQIASLLAGGKVWIRVSQVCQRGKYKVMIYGGPNIHDSVSAFLPRHFLRTLSVG
jgi:hypothetical protein